MFALLRSRRLVPWLAGLVLTALVIYVMVRLLAFAQLFGKLGPHAGVEITQEQLMMLHNATDPDPRAPLIPQVVHQIFHNWKEPGKHDIPEDWARMRQSCIDKNPGWDMKIWYTEESRTFIEDHFNWFLSTYDSYKFPIQRIDVMRYFLIRHYGGIYIDMDNVGAAALPGCGGVPSPPSDPPGKIVWANLGRTQGCEESLEALRYMPAFTTDGGLGALSNNIIGGQPEHPWLVMMTESLLAYKWNWLLPYAVVMYNSGQWYLTEIWEKYHTRLRADGTLPNFPAASQWAPLHRVLMDGRPGADRWVFFNNKGHGGTWGAGDDWIWAWIGEHWVQFVAELSAAIFFSVLACVCCVRCVRRRRMRRKGYQHLAAGDDDVVELRRRRLSDEIP